MRRIGVRCRGYRAARLARHGNFGERVGFPSTVSARARTILAAVAGALAFAAPASASEVLEYDGGRLVPKEIPALPSPTGPESLPGDPLACPAPTPKDKAPPPPRVSASATTVKRAIDRARRRGNISAAEARSYRAIYTRARRVRRRIKRYRRELSSVISVLEGIARRGRLNSTRMPALFSQLSRNTQFWGGRPRFPRRPDVEVGPCESKPSGRTSTAGSRIVFDGSKVVYQYYPGQGLQLQPLANFGMANGLVTQCRREPAECDRDGLRQLLAELIAMRSKRGGFTTWEYWFHFGGGTPPWTSGLSQGTAIQALTRASEPSILNDRSYLRVARGALGAFQKRPPVGVRVRAHGGSHYLIYSFDPGLRVLNGFLQSITGLYDYARISGDRTARTLWRRGHRAARNELRLYDTGRWSTYSERGDEATLGYHKLVIDFLGDLCKRIGDRYCVYRDRFTRYLGPKPRLRYTGPRTATSGRRVRLRFRVNMRSCVIAKIRDATGKVVYREGDKVRRGARSFAWTPRLPGIYTLKLQAASRTGKKRIVTYQIRVT